MKKYDKYKDSGVEWIGSIPYHWKLKPLKFLLKKGKDGIRIGPFGSSLKSDIIQRSGLKVYGQENVINDDFTLGYRYINKDKFDELSEYEIESGDVLITMMGTTGKSKIVPLDIKRGIMDSHLIRMRFDDVKILPVLISFLINESYYIYNQVKYLSKGSIMEGLNSATVKSFLIAVPPIDEQGRIVDFIINKIGNILKAIERKNN
jgi:type I restriction enzyme S subunit